MCSRLCAVFIRYNDKHRCRPNVLIGVLSEWSMLGFWVVMIIVNSIACRALCVASEQWTLWERSTDKGGTHWTHENVSWWGKNSIRKFNGTILNVDNVMSRVTIHKQQYFLLCVNACEARSDDTMEKATVYTFYILNHCFSTLYKLNKPLLSFQSE